MLIRNICFLANKKIDSNLINDKCYISTENLISNFGGFSIAKNKPNCKVTKFTKNDILISNIAPKSKKILFSTFNGGCSNDVLVLRIIDETKINPKYLFYSLSRNDFFKYYSSNLKGTTIPRGDKELLLNYKINFKSMIDQLHIVDTIDYLFLFPKYL